MNRLAAWRTEIDEARLGLADRRLTPGGFAGVLDRIVRELAEGAGWHRAGRAVVALGGYGRREMAPRSDVDLLFLTDRRRGAADPGPVLYALWDLGLDVGHALRTPRDCLRAARQDLTAATALLDGRLLAGDPGLLERALRRARVVPRPTRHTRAWARAVVDGVGARHSRFGEASHPLEPHLKEGWGGLRDVHAARWVLAWLGADPDDTVPRLPGGPQALAAVRFLGRVRAVLHLVAGRKTDRLTREHHVAVAERLMPGATPNELLSRTRRAAHSIAALWRSVEDAFAGLARPTGRPDSPLRPGRFRAPPGPRGVSRAGGPGSRRPPTRIPREGADHEENRSRHQTVSSRRGEGGS